MGDEAEAVEQIVARDVRIVESRRTLSVPVLGLAGETAIHLLAVQEKTGSSGLLHVAPGERRAMEIVQALCSLDPGREVVMFPPWDCLPYDSAPPSRDVMGRRVSAMRDFAGAPDQPRIVVTTPLGILQRLPPRETWRKAAMTLAVGDPVDLDDLQATLQRIGYILDERVDEPGEAALRGQVIDLYPAGSTDPVRIDHGDGRITQIRLFDPATQLTKAEVAEVAICPASEYVEPAEDGTPRSPGIEHRLAELYPRLETLLDYMPNARLSLDRRVGDRVVSALAQIADAFDSRSRLGTRDAASQRPLEPSRMFMQAEEWAKTEARVSCRFTETEPGEALSPVPAFAAQASPFRKLSSFLEEEMRSGQRVVLAAAGEHDLERLVKQVVRYGAKVERAGSWADIARMGLGTIAGIHADLGRGFMDREAGLTLVTDRDVLGSRARANARQAALPPEIAGTEIEFRIGDVVVHKDRGLGRLEGLETVEADGAVNDLVRLCYANDATLMVPVQEMGLLWRYGSGEGGVALDRLDGESWLKRRADVEAEVTEAARGLTNAMRSRQSAVADNLVPPRTAYERFVARFPYAETPDQLAAIEAVLADLASGRPMNRLVCGDVGFGKTEVALRAAAAAALAGKQVAIVAPTTVLARQHAEAFAKRFAGLDLEVAQLSRLTGAAAAKEVKEGLASGRVRVVIGTHALAGKGVRFADLGLVVIDEEQRFGASHKAKIRSLGRNTHVLTLTATPIPRTLQAALVGLQDISIIATPPSRRQPIRTFVTAFDEATLREALLRERRRGGQSFVVCPRIEDIAPLAKRLAALVPELQALVAHGRLPAEEIDDVMVRFADGEGDVLLATNIIESGLDVPRANTMLIWRADRFGLSQLHQLRGRVGRGRLRGVAYLLTDPEQALHRATRKRLETLESLDRLGAGFAISARDLDQRGAGDLLGDDQAGHMKLIGIGLYQHLLQKALAAANGTDAGEDWSPDLNVGFRGFIPADYVPEPEVRINLYHRFATLASAEAVEALAEEIEDRFGPPPEPVGHLLALAGLRQQCRTAGIARLDAGPQAIAVTFRPGHDASVTGAVARSKGALSERDGRLIWKKTAETEAARLDDLGKFFRFLDKVGPQP